jgi:hypothetical protein
LINLRSLARLTLGYLRPYGLRVLTHHRSLCVRAYGIACWLAAYAMFVLLVMPRRLVLRRADDQRFAATRPAGWKTCQIPSWQSPVYADAYRVSPAPDDTMPTASRSGWRVLRCLSCLAVRPTSKDTHQPPTDTYAMF